MRRDRVRIRTGLLREFGLEGPIAASAAQPWPLSSIKCRARLNFGRIRMVEVMILAHRFTPAGILAPYCNEPSRGGDSSPWPIRLGVVGRSSIRPRSRMSSNAPQIGQFTERIGLGLGNAIRIEAARDWALGQRDD